MRSHLALAFVAGCVLTVALLPKRANKTIAHIFFMVPPQNYQNTFASSNFFVDQLANFSLAHLLATEAM